MEDTDSPEYLSEITIRPLGVDDIEQLRPILESTIKDPDTNETITEEVESIITDIIDSLSKNNDKEYLVATSAEKVVIGMMGLRPACEAMRGFAQSENPCEIINAFVDQSTQKSGVGSELVKATERKAFNDGYTEVIVNSGPRYRDTGWAFWQKMYGEPSSVAAGYYGEGRDAMVWRKSLAEIV